jgi:hypothetical protein
MPDVIERATSGRAKCRGCERAIGKDGLRFGEALPNPYGEGEAVYWLHLPCAALMRPDPFLAALRSSTDPIPERDWLESAAEAGVAHPRLPRLLRAERSPSGRARCRQCRGLVEQGAWRLALHIFEEGRFASIGCIHARCSEAYFGTRDIVDRLRRLTLDLTDEDAREVARLLGETGASSEVPDRLRKTQPTPASADVEEPPQDERDRRTAG